MDINKQLTISVASGKGGTGKTTVATNLAFSIKNVKLLDCDVEEPNCAIFVKPKITLKQESNIPVPQVDLSKCTFCGKCRQVCFYNAIAVLADNVLVFPQLCHGCGACSHLCPQKAITEVNRVMGFIESGKKNNLDFVQGKLNIGEAMSPPLIRIVKQHIDKNKINIIDAPPGTSCPVVTSINGCDFCILVTEPTPFGLHDLSLAVELTKKLKIPIGIIINKSEKNNDIIDKYCEKEKIPILMRIPFKKEIASSYSKGTLLIKSQPKMKQEFIKLYKQIYANCSHRKFHPYSSPP